MDPEQVVTAAQAAGASYADVRVETTEQERMQWKDGEVRGISNSVETAYAIRVLVGGAWGFAAGNDGSGAALRRMVADAVRLAARVHVTEPVVLADAPVVKADDVWAPRIDPRDVDPSEKVALLRDMDARVREHAEIRSVSTGYSDTTLRKEYVDSDGRNIRWGLTRSVAQAHFTAKRGELLAGRSTRVGATKGWETFQEEDPIEKCAEAADAIVRALGARAAKGGRRTVVVDHELAGVLAHEAVGHACEADLVRAEDSCLRGKMGERIGIEGLTIHDHADMRGAFGAYPYDDDGVRAGDRILVEDGVLRGYLADRENGHAVGVAPNGASRAQDGHSRPMVRMATTLIEPGTHTEDEVFEGIKDGIYCKGSRGGQVDTARGTYLFNAQEAYVIRDGEIQEPLRDVSLTGEILATLHNIEALGNKQQLGDPGYCGKGQWVPVCDGGPLVRIADCLVGGT